MQVNHQREVKHTLCQWVSQLSADRRGMLILRNNGFYSNLWRGVYLVVTDPCAPIPPKPNPIPSNLSLSPSPNNILFGYMSQSPPTTSTYLNSSYQSTPCHSPHASALRSGHLLLFSASCKTAGGTFRAQEKTVSMVSVPVLSVSVTLTCQEEQLQQKSF